MFPKLQILFAIVAFTLVEADFSEGFRKYLRRLYGPTIQQQLSRLDRATDAAYGGGNSSFFMRLDRDPIILVNGLNSYSGRLTFFRDYFEANGYQAGSVFATTYGPNGTNIGVNDELICDYFKQVRRLILAVSGYTLRKVKVVPYSMGSAVSRKAILGGKCLDKNEDLGISLTSIVSGFISVGGVNQGLGYCYQNLTSQICNNKTGIIPNSKLMQNINSRRHYEGKKVYLISSTTDELVLYENTKLPYADVNVTVNGPNHVGSGVYTLRTQLGLLLNNQVTQQEINADMADATAATGVSCSGSFQ